MNENPTVTAVFCACGCGGYWLAYTKEQHDIKVTETRLILEGHYVLKMPLKAWNKTHRLYGCQQLKLFENEGKKERTRL